MPFLQTNFCLLFSWGGERCVDSRIFSFITTKQVLNLINIMHKGGEERRRGAVSYDCRQDGGHKTENFPVGWPFSEKQTEILINSVGIPF